LLAQQPGSVAQPQAWELQKSGGGIFPAVDFIELSAADILPAGLAEHWAAPLSKILFDVRCRECR